MKTKIAKLKYMQVRGCRMHSSALWDHYS